MGVVFTILAAIDGVDARDEVLGVVFVPANMHKALTREFGSRRQWNDNGR